MSFVKKIKETTRPDIVKPGEVFDNVYPTRISNISYKSVIERQVALKEFEDKDRDILITQVSDLDFKPFEHTL